MITKFSVRDYLPVRGPAALAAHDAGAASHIAAWFSNSNQPLCLYAEGPAKALFKKAFGQHLESSLESAICKSSVLITGTGWESDLEHKARLLAADRNVPSIAVLDHWTNYRERFQRDGQDVLPDQLWTADSDATALATTIFPGVPVLQLPNLWLEGICGAVHALRSKTNHQPCRPARRLLYLLEPIRVPWSQGPGGASEAGEAQGLRYWLQQLPHLIDQGWVAPQLELEALALRPHPSEPAGKYDALIAEASAAWPIQLDGASRLAEALAWADAAFGCETQALVAAMACDLPAFSTIPPWAPPCRLPQASLHHLRRLESS
jgi:hypothetical protein